MITDDRDGMRIDWDVPITMDDGRWFGQTSTDRRMPNHIP